MTWLGPSEQSAVDISREAFDARIADLQTAPATQLLIFYNVPRKLDR
jgi:hypothetical protein